MSQSSVPQSQSKIRHGFAHVPRQHSWSAMSLALPTTVTTPSWQTALSVIIHWFHLLERQWRGSQNVYSSLVQAWGHRCGVYGLKAWDADSKQSNIDHCSKHRQQRPYRPEKMGNMEESCRRCWDLVCIYSAYQLILRWQWTAYTPLWYI